MSDALPRPEIDPSADRRNTRWVGPARQDDGGTMAHEGSCGIPTRTSSIPQRGQKGRQKERETINKQAEKQHSSLHGYAVF
jgi:hypothetical protein